MLTYIRRSAASRRYNQKPFRVYSQKSLNLDATPWNVTAIPPASACQACELYKPVLILGDSGFAGLQSGSFAIGPQLEGQH